MAKPKSKEKKVKRLYNQLARHADQPSMPNTYKPRKENPLNRRSRIEVQITTLENTK